MQSKLKSYLKTSWVAIICLIIIVMSNINLGSEVQESSQILSEKLDIIEGGMIALNSGVDDSFLPEISPDQLSQDFNIPDHGNSIEPNKFQASLASSTEQMVIASVSKISNSILEIGTGKGGTTLIMASYSDPSAKVQTIDLPSTSRAILYEQGDSPGLAYTSVNSRTSGQYAYKNNLYENKITQSFLDTKNFDESKLSHKIDFIFVDGAKTYSYVKNDSEKAFNMIKEDGIIIWQNYNSRSPDVVRYLNEAGKDKKIYRIKGTNLAIFKA